jgi:WD40 repeat protein
LLSHVADLFITQKDGSNPRKLISLSEGHFGDATMSPDGRRIVFTRYGSPELYVANSDGTGVRLLAKNQEPGGFCCAKWTADGEYIVFATRFPVVRQDLWYLRMNHRWLQPANQPQRLTAGPLSYSNPTPSRDGKTIFAIGTRWRGELFRYDLTSKTLAPYFPGLFAYDPTFSRDGKWVAYLSYTDHCLWRSRSDGTERLQLTFSPLQVWDASISPDGKWVAYQSAEGPGIISADGGVPTKPSASFFVGVNWSPDGNFLVFNEGTSSWQTPEVKLLDVRTGQVRLVPGGQMHPVWAAPDKIIAARRDLMILQIYNLSTQRWSDLTKPEDGPVVNWARSPDFKYFYYTAARDPKIIRIRMADLKSEVVGSLKDFPLARGASDPTQISIAPDYSPIFTRQISAQEIYALTVKFP